MQGRRSWQVHFYFWWGGLNDSWGWWIFLPQLSICIRRAAIIINGALFVLFVVSCDIGPWDSHQSSSCLHCVIPRSYWSRTITSGEKPISVFVYLSLCIEICCQHLLRAIRYADQIYRAHHDTVRSKSDSHNYLSLIYEFGRQSVDSDVKTPAPLRWQPGGLGLDSLAFVAAMTSVLSDLVSWHRDRSTGNIM